MRTSNPMFSTIGKAETHYGDIDAATYGGVTLKTIILLGLTVLVSALTAYFLPSFVENNNMTAFSVVLGIAAIVSFISVIVGRMSFKAAKYASAIYAACEGMFLGTLTCMLELVVPGIATIAIFSTVIIFGIMLVLYATGVLRTGSFLRKFLSIVVFGGMACVLFIWIFGLFNSYIYSNIGLVIMIDGILLLFGAFTLLMNFDEATMVVKAGCPKEAEWSVALGLTISVVYIYVQLLRILAIVLANSDNN